MVRPIDPSGLLGAFGNLANVNARQTALREQKRANRMGSLGAMAGAGIGFAATGGNPQGAMIGMNLGKQAGSAMAGGPVDVAGTTGSVLGIMNFQQNQAAQQAAQEQQAQEAARREQIAQDIESMQEQPGAPTLEPGSQMQPGLGRPPGVPSFDAMGGALTPDLSQDPSVIVPEATDQASVLNPPSVAGRWYTPQLSPEQHRKNRLLGIFGQAARLGDVGGAAQGALGLTAPAPPPKAPTTREIKVGDSLVTQEWVDGAWRNVGAGDRFQAPKPETGIITLKPPENARDQSSISVGMWEEGARKRISDLTARGYTKVTQTSQQNLSPPTRSELEKKVVNTTQARERLSGIKQAFDQSKGRFLTTTGQAGEWLLQKAAGVAPGLIPESGREFLKDAAVFRQRTINNLNLYVNELSGAAVSEQEAKRLQAGLPNKDDDPITFEAKMNESLADMDASLKRYEFFLENGFVDQQGNPTAAALSRFPLAQFRDSGGGSAASQSDDDKLIDSVMFPN